MPGLFLAAIFFAVLALVAVAIRSFIRDPDGHTVLGWGVAALGFLSAVFLVLSCLTSVGTKEEGIETSFGATVGHLSNGLHVKAPWVLVHEMDAAIQTDAFTGQSCVSVRIANQQTGCANVTIQWRIDPASSDELYKDYRSFDKVREALVTRQLDSAVNHQLATYNPLDSIHEGTPASGAENPTNTQLADRILTQMRSEIGSRIDVLNVILPLITFDSDTQSRINQLQQQIALTRIAEQARITNLQQAKANKALAASVNRSPNVLVADCMDTLAAMVKADQSVPAGFSCWPSGGPTPVIATASK